jgi:hypothetical protein
MDPARGGAAWLTGDRQLDIHVHRLTGGLGKDSFPWSDAFLPASLTPPGHGLVGMASDARAWAALPFGCADPSAFPGHAEADVAMGYDGPGFPVTGGADHADEGALPGPCRSPASRIRRRLPGRCRRSERSTPLPTGDGPVGRPGRGLCRAGVIHRARHHGRRPT